MEQRLHPPVVVATVLAVIFALLVAVTPAAWADGHAVTHETVAGAGGTPIAISIHRPAGASADHPVPVILHSHGWGGSRTTGANSFAAERARGYAVVSIDQRGHGASGGQRHVQNPELEGLDIVAVIDRVAELDWVLKDTDAEGNPIPDDPVLFAMGGSYGGAYQLVGALTDQRLREARGLEGNRFNALAPEIAWYDLSQALAPDGVVRTAWVLLLYAAGAGRIADHIHPAFAYGTSTGQWPDGTVPLVANIDEEFRRNGPAGFVADGMQLDLPVLIGQGLTDNLFNGNEGWHNFERALTPRAQAQSLFVGYNGGHALPNVLPLGVGPGGDPCSSLPEGVNSFGQLRLAFFDAVLAGENPQHLLGSRYSLSTVANGCIQSSRLDHYDTVPLSGLIQVDSNAVTTTGLGLPQHHQLVEGPVTIAGVPQLRADVSSLGADQRAFFALSVGTSPLDAQVIQNNMMPIREPLPVVRESRVVELPLVAVEVPAGQSLFLTVSAISDMSFGHGSLRTPGAILLEGVEVDLPVPVLDPVEDPEDPKDPKDPEDPEDPEDPDDPDDPKCQRPRPDNPGRGRGPDCPGRPGGTPPGQTATGADPSASGLTADRPSEALRPWWRSVFRR